MLSLMSQRGNTSAMVKGFYYVSLDSNYFVYKVGVGYNIRQLLKLSSKHVLFWERERESKPNISILNLFYLDICLSIFFIIEKIEP